MTARYILSLLLLAMSTELAAQDQGKLWMSLRGSNPQVPRTTIDSSITLTSPADVVSRRASLINNAWAVSTGSLPTTLPTVTANATMPPFSGPPFNAALTNVARVDAYIANSPTLVDSNSAGALLYVAGTGNNGRVVILNFGHQGYCDFSQYPVNYRAQQILQDLLTKGYSAFTMDMPGCNLTGDWNAQITAHNALFTTNGDKGMGAFLDVAIQAMNFWDAHAGNNCSVAASCGFRQYDCIGLSGGGWTCTSLPALDRRVRLSAPVSGSMPGVQFVSGASAGSLYGDGEQGQYSVNFYTIAGYLDLYIMGSSGTVPSGAARGQLQTLNHNDDCCFGNTNWTNPAFNYQTLYGVTYSTYIANYATSIQNSESSIPGNYTLHEDTIVTTHTIGADTEQRILNFFDANPPILPGGGSARRGLK